MYVYVDVLIVTSVYIDFLLIKASAALLHRRPTDRRCIIAALAGSLFSLGVLLPSLGSVGELLFRTVSAAVIVLIAFGFGNLRRFLCTLAAFFASGCLFAGVCIAISQFSGRSVLCRNGGIYIDIPLLILICSTAAAYGAARLFRRLSPSDAASAVYTVTVSTRGPDSVRFSFPAEADSGNFLRDPVTGTPVIVCPADVLSEMFSVRFGEELPPGWRLIPYNTASGCGLMAVCRPDSIVIHAEGDSLGVSADAYIGAASYPMEYAVFNPKLLS